MQRFAALSLFLAACSTGHVRAELATGAISPVTRVVDLLKSLSAKVEFEGKAEQDLYETFVCWAKSVISTKTASNEAANSRIDTLKTYVADLDAGRIELTSERKDLEKEIEQLSGDIEVAKSLREEENKQFQDAKDEMDKAITALTSAIDVLKTATDDHKEGVFLRLRSTVNQGFTSSAASSTAESAALSYAVELGSKFLSKGDSVFLERVLTGEVPQTKPDWKKLNRDATFKKSYKARSFKIQDVLANLLETFTSNLANAEDKEAKAKATYDALMKSKNDEKASAQQALTTMAKENGAKGLSRSEATDELTALETQTNSDTKYIGQVETTLADKKTEWKERSQLRAGELQAVSKAIAILTDDDARDLFKKSFKSQSYSLLQQDSTAHTGRRGSAAEALWAAAHAVHDHRLVALAMRLSTTGHFDEVLTSIDNMIDLLKGEEGEDLKQKSECEEDRADDTRSAILDARNIDDKTDMITNLEAEVADLMARIKEEQAEVAEIEKEKKEANAIRAKENAEFLAAKKDDEDAIVVVQNAIAVLQEFYTSNGLMLVQQKQHKAPPQSAAGEAPPPPPTTWEAPYGGRTEESTGILSVMGMIKEDIDKDITHATTNEKKSKDFHDAAVLKMSTTMDDLNGLIGEQEITKGEKEQAIKDTKSERTTLKGSLDATTAKIKAADPGCIYFTVYYEVRRKNRHIEIDGLHKAKAILSGATFTKEDENRELKPGDAFLQHVRKH